MRTKEQQDKEKLLLEEAKKYEQKIKKEEKEEQSLKKIIEKEYETVGRHIEENEDGTIKKS